MDRTGDQTSPASALVEELLVEVCSNTATMTHLANRSSLSGYASGPQRPDLDGDAGERGHLLLEAVQQDSGSLSCDHQQELREAGLLAWRGGGGTVISGRASQTKARLTV